MLPLRHWIDRQLLGHRVNLEVAREQRLTFMRRLTRVRPHMTLAAEELNDRLLNLYETSAERWHHVDGLFDGSKYYFTGLVHRVLALHARTEEHTSELQSLMIHSY